jgi:hypothetical protein
MRRPRRSPLAPAPPRPRRPPAPPSRRGGCAVPASCDTNLNSTCPVNYSDQERCPADGRFIRRHSCTRRLTAPSCCQAAAYRLGLTAKPWCIRAGERTHDVPRAGDHRGRAAAWRRVAARRPLRRSCVVAVQRDRWRWCGTSTSPSRQPSRGQQRNHIVEQQLRAGQRTRHGPAPAPKWPRPRPRAPPAPAGAAPQNHRSLSATKRAPHCTTTLTWMLAGVG